MVTSGVGEGIAEAADTGEVIIGLVLGVVVVGLAAMAISYVVLPSLRHLSTAYSAALDGKPSASSRGYYLTLRVCSRVEARCWSRPWEHGATDTVRQRGSCTGAQQGALILVGGLVLGGVRRWHA
ncbi:MAG: hypothetical protein IPH72_26955 [Sandaracinaceae bacterium]|nr:hypothetical protein [Sandaracinaceae bacterium]